MESKSDGNPLIPPSPHTHHTTLTLLCCVSVCQARKLFMGTKQGPEKVY